MILFYIYLVMIGYVYSETHNQSDVGTAPFTIWTYSILWPLIALSETAAYVNYKFFMWGR